MPQTRRALSATLLAVSLGATGPAAIAQTDAPREPLWEIGAVALGVSQQAWPGASEEVQRALAVPYLLYRGPWLRIDRGAAGREDEGLDAWVIGINRPSQQSQLQPARARCRGTPPRASCAPTAVSGRSECHPQ